MTVLGIVFVVLAAGFFLAELEMPGIGVAAAAGTLSLLMGVMFLIDDLPSIRVRLAIAIPTVVVVTIAAVVAGRVTRRRSTQPSSTTGPALLIGELASVRASSDGPQAFVAGAWWSIRPQHPDNELRDELLVQVVALEGLTLVVDAPTVEPPGTDSPNIAVQNYLQATSQIAQTTLRSILGQVELDDLLIKRDEINTQLQHIIDGVTDPWGVKVSLVEIKDVELPESMRRAMGRQAEAERERRSKIIHAEGEREAAAGLGEAAAVLGRSPGAMQLRLLSTMTEVAAERNSTLIFPVPVELLRFVDRMMPAAETDVTRSIPSADS